MRKIVIIIMIIIALFICAVITFSASEEKQKPEKIDKFEGTLMEFKALGFEVRVPEKKWKVAKTGTDTMPLEISHESSALIQLMTLQKTMTTIPEIMESLNKTYKEQFSEDGAQDYKILKDKDIIINSLPAKRVAASFKNDKEEFLLDQFYVEGPERIYVVLLTSKKSDYKAVKSAFEGMAESIRLAETKDPGTENEQEKEDVHNSGKGKNNQGSLPD